MLPPMRADDPFLDRYAHGTRAMTASEIRALFAVASRPEVVSLAGGMPFTAALPFDVIGEVAAEVLDKEGPTALQYGGGQGDPRLREILVELMRLEGIHASGEDVVVTIGSQQALDLLARMFCDPGDVIVAEGPSYVGALSAFSQYQVEVRHAPLDDDGLDPDGLAQVLSRLDREGKRVKLLYTVPNFHNPAGVTMSAERRDRVLKLARQHNVLVVEDNPYGRLGFESDPPQALRAQDADNVVYLGSLSKIFCPGLRIGWALVPPSLRERMVIVKEAADLSSSNFAQAMAYRYFAEYPWRETLKELRVIYRERRDAMLESLRTGGADAVFLALHGRFGEDGTVAALLELLGLPYTGSTFDASRLAFDKLAAKSVLGHAGLAVPPAIPVAEGALRELGMGALLDRAMDELGLPLVVKPNRGGSALGIRLVERPEQLAAALMTAFGYDDTVLLERHVTGTERAVTVVVGLARLTAVEIRPKEGWYDFAARYTHGAVDFRAPAELAPSLAEHCFEVATSAHLALGCRDLSRVDAILDGDGTCWILEVNTGPGLTSTSLVPIAADAAGISFADLTVHLTNRAIARRPR